MIRRLIRYIVKIALSEQGAPVLITVGNPATVEWRFWPSNGDGTGWYKVTQEPYGPDRRNIVGGLIGGGESSPLVEVLTVYRRGGERYYVVELSSTTPQFHQSFPPNLREALIATGWQVLPADVQGVEARIGEF